MRNAWRPAATAALLLCAAGRAPAQNAAAAPAPPTPRAAAMIDLTGYWVSVITEDWNIAC